MEEKKRRPRITKGESDAPLKEQEQNDHNENQTSEQPSFERWSQPRSENQPPPYERRRPPYDNDRPPAYNRDRNENERSYNNDRAYNSGRNDHQQGGGGYNRPYNNDRPAYNRGGDRNEGGGGGYNRPYNNDRPAYNRGGDRNEGGGGGYNRPYNNDRPAYNRDRNEGGGGGGFRKPFNRGGGGFGKKPFRKNNDYYVERKPKPEMPTGEGMPLNKYLAHCGISSRRKAVEYIEEGKVTVNGIGKAEPFYRVQAGDVVVCDGKPLTVQERMVYVLLNKPKNVITTSDDERGRTTVLDIVDSSFSERLFPVGRLDRDTTGLIMLTNDGDLAHKLTHPSFNIQKQYRVGLRSSLKQADLEAIEKGVELEDGVLEVNWIRFSEDHPERDMVELEISNGRNRVVRRLFEHLGYEVYKLDRFYFAGLTKKELARGAFRELTQREVMMLRHFTGHPSTAKKKKKKYYDDNGNAEEVNPTADDESDDIEIDDIEMEGEDNITDDKD
jgi:23S rRNA pseudouridine2605 synthase